MPQGRQDDPDPGKILSGMDEETAGRRNSTWHQLRNGTVSGILANIEKESSFNPTNTFTEWDGSVSYGICQWNGSRRTALTKFCKDNGYSVSSITGQLKYLQYELSHSESSAWSHMQGIDNSASGAYTAGCRWAQYFERCAHYWCNTHKKGGSSPCCANAFDQYEVRGVRARDAYWPEYNKNNNNIISSLDIVEAKTGTVHVRGWSFNNEDYSCYVTVDTYIGGPAGDPKAEGFRRTANQLRADVEDVHGKVGKNHGFDYTFATSKSGTQDVYVYAINTKGRPSVLLGKRTVNIPKDTVKPVVSDAQIQYDSKGYTVTCKVSDNVSVAQVKFPTWTAANNQDDITWGIGTIKDGIATYRVNRSDHNNEKGQYITDIYAYDKEGNESLQSSAARVMHTFESKGPEIGDVEVELLSDGYKLIWDVTDDSGISKVIFPTWTAFNGQDDIDKTWGGENSHSLGTYNKATGKATFTVKYSDHNDEYGLYVTDLYAYDDLGNLGWGRKHVEVSPEVFHKVESEYGGHRYVLYDCTQGWEKAKEYCESKGGHLVTITSAAENAAVLNLAQRGVKGHYIIGAESVGSKGTWRWVTGEDFSYSNWDPEGTEGNTEGEPYGYLISINNPPYKQSGEWIDGQNAYETKGFYHFSNCGFICEYESDEPEHVHTVVTDPAVPATCHSPGYTEGSHCSECGEVIVAQEILPMTEHVWDANYSTIAEPTCEEEGCEWILCSVCGEPKEGSGKTIDKLGHDYGDWTKKDETEHQRICKHDDSHIETAPHEWDDGTVSKPATETEEGILTYKCTSCGATKEEVIPALTHVHQLSRVPAKQKTCTEDGNLEYWKCDSCGKIFSDMHCTIELKEKDVIEAAAGHKTVIEGAKEATCTEDGYSGDEVCTVCKETVKAGHTIPAPGHIPVIDPAIEATCHSEGRTEGSHCSVCGETIVKQSVIPMSAHQWNKDITIITQPLCDKDGYGVITCSVCGETKDGSGKAIDKLGHSYGVWVGKNETVHERTCRHDGNHVETEAHKWDNGTVTKTASETEEGIIIYKCTVCEMQKAEKTPVLGHTHKLVKIPEKRANCTEEGNIEYWRCDSCGKIFNDSKCSAELNKEDVKVPATGHTPVIDPAVEPTATSTGLTEGSHCSVCGTVLKKQEIIPKRSEGQEPTTTEQQTDTKPAAPSDPEHPDVKVQEKKITNQVGDADPAGSTYILLSARVTKSKKTSNTLKWNKVKGASGYIVYGNRCGTQYRFEKIAEVTKTGYVHKSLKKGTYYKYLVVAYKSVSGNKTVLATSKTMHAATTGGKVGNCRKLKLNKKKVTLKRKKTFKIKAKEVAASKKLKIKRHRKIAFESTNPKIATVTKAGKIKGLKKGSCKIYVYAQNGVYKVVKVKVK